MMPFLTWMFWGFVATLAQAIFEAIASGLHLSRMSLPFMLGTMWTPNRSRAKVLGFFNHMLNGLFFTLFYVASFHFLGAQNWWIGALLGLAQACFVLLIVVELLPSIHPRMASEESGVTAMKQLEPPGFLALNYGSNTPIAVVVSHVIFGTILGNFC